MGLSLQGRRLRPIGKLVRANNRGELPRLGCAPVGPLGEAIIEFAEALYSKANDPELSVVLRGSLARGGSSPADIDLTLIAPGSPKIPSFDALPPLPLPVEMGLIPMERFQDPIKGAWPRFLLGHCGWNLAGPDRLNELPAPRMGPVVIAHLRGVRTWWPRYPDDWSYGQVRRKLTNGWLAKRIIRSLAEGEMARRELYSRDVWPCLQIASLAFPTHTKLLTYIAEQAVFPSGDYVDRARLLTARPLLERAHALHLHQPLKLPS